MQTKTCKTCNKTLAIKNFKINKSGVKRWTNKDGTKRDVQVYKHSNICNACKEKKEKFKECKICKKILPKTEEYFPRKVIKQQNKAGEVIYYSYRHGCRVCINEMHRNISKQYYKNNKEKENARYKKWRKNNIELARALSKKWQQENKQKQKAYDKKRIQNLTDSIICNRLGVKIGEVPQEIIETKRLIIKLKRKLNIN
jgi:hypothetical protein